MQPSGASIVFSIESPGSAIALPLPWDGTMPIGVGCGLSKPAEILVFQAGARMRRLAATDFSVIREALHRPLPVQEPLNVFLRFWLAVEDLGVAENQVEAVNRVLVSGAGVDSGIRLCVREYVPLQHPVIRTSDDLGCLRQFAEFSLEPDTVDVFLHHVEWPCRACPSERRIFLSRPRLTEFTLAHEFLHLLGMPDCAHVDENRYLARGNVMDRSPLGGMGQLTLGQLCIMNISAHSLAARLRQQEDRSFPLRQCLDDQGEPLDAPPLGLTLPESAGQAREIESARLGRFW